MHNRVREAELKVQLVALSLSTVAHANQSELLFKAHGHTLVHVRHESTHRADVGVGFTGFFKLLERKNVAVLFDSNLGKNVHTHFTLRALDGDKAVGERGAHALGELNGMLANTRHIENLPN